MIQPFTQDNERERLQALLDLHILDTPPEHRFDRITAIAKELFSTPIALITLVDEDRQWFKSNIGLDQAETPRCVSFCAHAVNSDSALIVEDATKDERFCDNPLVTGDLHLRFYAGYPIHSPEGFPIGALCIIDNKPRRFDAGQKKSLKELADIVDGEIKARQATTSHIISDEKQMSHTLSKIGSVISQRWTATVIASVVFCIVMLFIQDDFLHQLENERLKQQTEQSETLFNLRGRLETELNSRLHLTQGLAGYVRSSSADIDINIDSFQNFAADLGGSLPGIRGLQLAPNGVLTYIWPKPPSQTAFGHNLLTDNRRKEAAHRAITEKKLWIAGPLELVMGGTAIVGRQPIFKKTIEGNGETFWGFSIVLVDLPTILEKAGFNSLAPEQNVAIRGRDGLGENGEVFYGSKSVFENSPIKADIALPSGSWQLAINAPLKADLQDIPSQQWLVATSLAIFISLLLYILLRLPYRYAKSIEQAKKELDQSHARFKDAIESLPDGFAVFDTKDKLVNCNERYRTFFLSHNQSAKFGITFEDLLRKSVEANLYILNDNSIEGKQKYINERLVQHKKPNPNGIEVHLQSGQWIRVLESRVPNGDTIISYTDISVLKHKEHGLAKEKARAEEANKAKTTFLATVSHELRTPMNAILGLLNLVQSSGDLNPQNQEYINTTNESAEHLLALLNELLDLSKMEADKIELELSQFNLAQIVLKALKLSEGKAQQKKLELIDDIKDQADVIVKGDAGRLQQILLNLISNGIKFTNKGTVSVSVSRTQNDFFVFKVIDSGIGFTEQESKSLFKPFSQLDSSASRRHEGTGLGLAICKRLVNAMGGAITAKGSLGQGSTFELSIPLTVVSEGPLLTPTLEQDTPVPTPLSEGRSSIRVLIAEDSPANQIVFKAMLKNTGYVVDIVGNGLEAVEALTTLSYDIILMDIFMPEMDGLEATKIIRKEGTMDNKPIIALTANAMQGDQQKFIEAGMDDYLAKPAAKNELLLMLHKWTFE